MRGVRSLGLVAGLLRLILGVLGLDTLPPLGPGLVVGSEGEDRGDRRAQDERRRDRGG